MSSSVKNILTNIVAVKKLQRMALEIAERNYNVSKLILIGIKDNGLVIANKVAGYLKDNFKGEIIVLELSMHKRQPTEVIILPNTNFDNEIVILIDDVANSGKTMLYALKPLLQMHPKEIQTLALVERTHKTFPVFVDYVGVSVSTTLDEHIFVDVENNEVIGARLIN